MVAGRPRAFKSVEDFVILSDAYFEAHEGEKISWTGLCLAVGVCSRQSLDRYRNGEHGAEFVVPIKRALMVVENYYEETAEGAKSIFIMKNFDWKDKTEVDQNIKLSTEDMSDADLDKELEDLSKE